MGFTTAFNEVLKGNFSDAANYLFMDEEGLAATREVSTAQEKLIQERAASGNISDEQQAAYLNEIQRNAYPYLFDRMGGPADVFVNELKTGVSNLPANFATGINKTLGAGSRFLITALPWYIWAILLIALFVYLAPFIAPALKLYAARKK